MQRKTLGKLPGQRRYCATLSRENRSVTQRTGRLVTVDIVQLDCARRREMPAPLVAGPDLECGDALAEAVQLGVRNLARLAAIGAADGLWIVDGWRYQLPGKANDMAVVEISIDGGRLRTIDMIARRRFGPVRHEQLFFPAH